MKMGKRKSRDMSHWENQGKSDEWYTPEYVFSALDTVFDVDVAGRKCPAYCVPSESVIEDESLVKVWEGFAWMNPPFGGRNSLDIWMHKFFIHGNGIALTPDRTSAPWFRGSWLKADMVMFTPKIKFLRPDGSLGKSPSNGTALWAIGNKGVNALRQAYKNNLGILAVPCEEAL